MALPFQTTLRWATEADFDALADVMFAAVREGESTYTEAQRQAWVPEPRRGSEWRTRLLSQEIIVAEADGRLFGFMSLAEGGYIDFAYIRAEARGAGLFRELFKRILERARAKGVRLLWVHASLTAEPAFAALGFVVRQREQVTLGGEVLDRFEMEMIL
jgi:putative acetyltransferase